MTFRTQNLSNPTRDDYPYEFSPLPLNASNVPLEVNSSTCEDCICQSDEDFPIVMRMVILMGFFVLIFASSSDCQIIPELEINSFSISNLNISASKMLAVWDTNIRFQHFDMNSTSGDVMYFDKVEGCIFYRNMDNKLAAAKEKAFSLRANETKTVQMRFMNTELEADQSGVEDEVVIGEISRELENGMMHFSLRIDFEVLSEKWGLRFSDMESYCWDLMAGVDPSTGKGRLITAQGVDCNI
ncbi:hypothetical protein SLE2022_155300 [Rubroshorea leprosula]